jgi:hypothetical protein
MRPSLSSKARYTYMYVYIYIYIYTYSAGARASTLSIKADAPFYTHTQTHTHTCMNIWTNIFLKTKTENGAGARAGKNSFFESGRALLHVSLEKKLHPQRTRTTLTRLFWCRGLVFVLMYPGYSLRTLRIYINTHTHTHKHIYIYKYVDIYIYM